MNGVKLLLDTNFIIGLVKGMTIKIRRQYKLKTPDAIIAATVKVMSLELLTLDQQLANRMMEILAGT